jgi:hypothetical protein
VDRPKHGTIALPGKLAHLVAIAHRSTHRHARHGDHARAYAYSDQFEIALEPEDVARLIMFALSEPRHVQIAQMVVLPVNRWCSVSQQLPNDISAKV